jgi:hypothetical protein
MSHQWIGSLIQQRIMVADKVYITHRMISDYAASSVTGRATRVWEAYEEGHPEEPYAILKDLWLDIESPSEGEILDDVLAKMEEYTGRHPELEDKDYRKHFLTKVVDWRVVLPGGDPDTTLKSTRGESFVNVTDSFPPPPEGGPSISSTEPTSSRTPRSESRSWNGVPPRARQIPKPSNLRRPRHLAHYRIVFLESGRPIHKLLTLKESFSCLRDSVQGKKTTVHDVC